MTASWDQQRFLSSLGPMQSMSAVFLKAFLQSVEQNITQFERVGNPPDYTLITRLAHSIKGSAGQVYCPVLAKLAADVENYALHQNDQTTSVMAVLLKQAQLECQLIRLFLIEQGE